jgi:ketosteroid isomerase-like protein
MDSDAAASGRGLVETYYDAVDAGDYDRLASVLAPDVVHDRPDRTLSGRETFVSFMRDSRPETETRHEVTATYRADDGGRVARGRLVGADGGVRFDFVDVFDVGDDGIRRIETFVRDDLRRG